MPRKDSSFNNREKKKNSKRNRGKNIYSSKHIRMQAALMNNNTIPTSENTSTQDNKKNKKNKSRKNK